MKKLVVVHYTDKNYSINSLIRSLIKVFNTEKYKNILLEKYGLEVVTSIDISTKLNSTDFRIIEEINGGNADFDGSIFFGIHPYGISHIKKFSQEVKKKKNIKTVLWLDDLHHFAHYDKIRKDRGISVQKYSEKYDPLFIASLDYLLSPSLVYFRNLDIIEYDSKLIDMFYFLPPYCFEKQFQPYSNRKNEIILSGVIGGGYTSRILFQQMKKRTPVFDKLIHIQPHPRGDPESRDTVTEMDYYNKLSEFKAAFVGHHVFPINFLLAKHIEVLMCGCLGFFEPNSLLESQLGLKEYVHYIPCYNDGKMIEDINFYTEWIDNGEEIAKDGQQFVMENFGERQLYKMFDFFKSIS